MILLFLIFLCLRWDINLYLDRDRVYKRWVHDFDTLVMFLCVDECNPSAHAIFAEVVQSNISYFSYDPDIKDACTQFTNEIQSLFHVSGINVPNDFALPELLFPRHFHLDIFN